MTPQQIAHIEQHQAAFEQLAGEGRRVEDYAREYAHIEDLYLDLCDDLGLDPLTAS